MNIKLIPVNKDNYWECVEMPKVQGVASNMISIVQAYVYEDWHPFCIYDEDKMIGFLMYGIDHEEEDKLWMIRLYIAEEHQNKGYGKATVKKLLELVKEKYAAKEIYTSTEPSNTRAFHVYESIGFKRTGKIEEGEEVLVYSFEG